MAVGDRLYQSCNWIPPIAHCPRARFADYLSSMMRCLYVDAQHYAMFCGATTYGWDVRDVVNDASNQNRRFSDATWVQVHKGRRTLPREITHVRGLFLYALPSQDFIDSYLRVRVIDSGANEDNASRTITLNLSDQIPRNNAAGHLNTHYGRDQNPFTGRAPPLLHDVCVPLSNVSTTNPGRCRVLLEQYAVNNLMSTQYTVHPLYYAAWAEVAF